MNFKVKLILKRRKERRICFMLYESEWVYMTVKACDQERKIELQV